MNKKLLLLLLVPIVAVLLAGCATGLTASSWPGITTKAQVAYVAGGPHLYAVNTQTGAELWRYPEKASTAYPFFAPPVLTSDGQLIFGGFDHKLYNLDPESRAEKWIFDGAKDRYISSVLIVGDVIYAPNSDYHLYAVNLKTGTQVWAFKADQSLWSAPVTDGTNVYFGSVGGSLYAVNAQSGSLTWEVDVNSAVLGAPLLKDGILYLTTYDGHLLMLDARNGKQVRDSIPVPGRVWSGPVLDGTMLYFGDANGNLFAFDLDGELLWQQALNGAVVGTPLISGGTLVIGTDLGNVYFLKLSDQSIEPFNVPGKVFTSPALAGSLYLVSPTDGDILLAALDKNGAQKWVFTPSK